MSEVIKAVRRDGENALRAYTRKWDWHDLDRTDDRSTGTTSKSLSRTCSRTTDRAGARLAQDRGLYLFGADGRHTRGGPHSTAFARHLRGGKTGLEDNGAIILGGEFARVGRVAFFKLDRLMVDAEPLPQVAPEIRQKAIIVSSFSRHQMHRQCCFGSADGPDMRIMN